MRLQGLCSARTRIYVGLAVGMIGMLLARALHDDIVAYVAASTAISLILAGRPMRQITYIIATCLLVIPISMFLAVR